MQLPPLNALRAFDAVARQGSVKGAAEEMHVTPAAVSQQLRTLEAHVGSALFERRPREIRLNVTGQSYHQSVGRALRQIAEATDRIRPHRRGTSITVITSFAALWLAPRFADFARRYPDIEVRIEADPNLADLVTGGFDLAIRTGKGDYPEADSRLLFALDLLPVAAPAYQKSLTRRGRFDWSRARLLHEAGVEYWETWLQRRGVKADTSRGLMFSHGMLAFAAAQAGEGVALAPYALVARMVQDGRLAVVDPTAFKTGLGYWLAWPKPALRPLPPSAEVFRDWIIAQARLDPAR